MNYIKAIEVLNEYRSNNPIESSDYNEAIDTAIRTMERENQADLDSIEISPMDINRRQVKFLNGAIQSFWVKGEKNPCGCGSNLFHLENDDTMTFGVCNCCELDIYSYPEREEFEEWKEKEFI